MHPMTDTHALHPRLPRRGLRIAHININRIRYKISEITNILFSDNIHILAISETHLDSTFEDAAQIIQGYNILEETEIKWWTSLLCSRSHTSEH